MQSSATNVTWHEHRVSQEKRAKQKHQVPSLIWFTGLSSAGKSTLANAVDARLFEMNHHCYVLDGDNVRHALNKDLGFSDEDRVENIRRIGEVSKLFLDAGLIVMTAFISPFRSDRETVRALFGDGAFIEVHVDTDLNVCEKRDPKGLYKKARAGEIANFTGIDSPYEAPEKPELRIDAGSYSIDACVDQIIEYLRLNHRILAKD